MPIDDEGRAMMLIQPVVKSCVLGFCRTRPGMDAEELIQECQKYALKAVRDFNGLGSLKGYVGYKVSRTLLSNVRWNKWRRRFAKPNTSFDDCIDGELVRGNDRPEPAKFSLTKFFESLSDDAQRVVLIALHCGTKELTVSRLLKLNWFRTGIEEIFAEIRRELHP